jgi:hypothetical protein
LTVPDDFRQAEVSNFDQTNATCALTFDKLPFVSFVFFIRGLGSFIL